MSVAAAALSSDPDDIFTVKEEERAAASCRQEDPRCYQLVQLAEKENT